MARSRKGVLLLPLTVVGLSALAGCVDEKTVFVDRELFEQPLTAAGSFLGYTDHAEKLTVCGNCHVEKQGDWIGTHHAQAFHEVPAGSEATCGGCHAITERGNVATDVVAYEATGEVRYEDVQCESCHGPGLIHVTNPKDSNAPLPILNVCDPVNDVCADIANDNKGCAECHAASHQPIAEEWDLSRHGSGANRPQYRTRSGCEACHSGEGALAAWGINTEFAEKGKGEAIGVTCAVCHDPHSDENEGQLRFSVSVPDVDRNLCMKCHQQRAIPDQANSQRGPHSPQGPLLLGELGTVGWTPPNFPYNVLRIRGTHGSSVNQKLCATCHLNSYDVSDAQTGQFVVSVTGHRFLPIPCVDANNVPTVDQTCGKTEAERNFGACTTSGCHGDETAALSALLTAQSDVSNLVLDLDYLLDQVDPAQFNSADTLYTVAEGARFNQGLGEIESSAVHNVFLTKALLASSIVAVNNQYPGLMPRPAAVDAEAQLRALVSQYGN